MSPGVSLDSIRAHHFSDTGRTRTPLLTVRAVEALRPRSQPDKITLDRGLPLRIAPDGNRRFWSATPSKARTRADCLGMVQRVRTTEKGTRQAAGFLYPIANKPLAELTAEDIRDACDTAVKKSPRRATYAMQVLRAVLRWHGVVIADNPLGRETACRDRITISAPRGDPSPIPPELLGAWWRAAGIAPSQVAADYYRFQLLTGCRGIEIHGHKQHG